ncbi:MAG: inositol monophosphatase family protein [Thermodesulfobacteriota bacterium]
MAASWDELAQTAAEVAREAGALIRERYAAPRAIRTKSARVDLVTDTDRAAERLILARLGEAYPEHARLGEESGFVPGPGPGRGERLCWVVDPLDGTTNFAHGVPHFAVSIAAVLLPEAAGAIPFAAHDAHPVAAAVYDPMRDELFVAAWGGAATCNGAAITVSATADLDAALLATGFPYDRRERASFYLSFWHRLLVAARDVRRIGAAALDLAWVACGRLDGFWEWNLHPWDVAAGTLLVRQAGGRVSDFRGGDPGVEARQTLASNGHIHEALLRDIAPLLDEAG